MSQAPAKKTIRLAIVDFSRKETPLVERLLGFVTDRYDFEITEDDPDFVLHSCMGYRALKFDGVRVFYTEENFVPDFNISDYALGMHRLAFGDRYYMLPLYRLYTETYAELFKPRRAPDPPRERFCACVVSNARRDRLFFDLFHTLERYRPVASGGRLLNNVGGRVPDKLAFMRTARFGLAVENSVAPGYITEKITDVFAAGAVPIYYGAPDVTEHFNPDAFIRVSDYPSLDALVEAVAEIDRDEERYRAMLEAPVFRDGVEPEFLREESIRRFLVHVFDQPREAAYRRNRQIRGQIYHKRLRTAFFRPHVQASRLLRDAIRRRKGKKVYIPPLRITEEGAVYPPSRSSGD